MKKIIDYRLIDRLDTNRLETEICSLLEDGWQLYGSPLMSGGGNDYVQAMVKYEADPKSETSSSDHTEAVCPKCGSKSRFSSLRDKDEWEYTGCMKCGTYYLMRKVK